MADLVRDDRLRIFIAAALEDAPRADAFARYLTTHLGGKVLITATWISHVLDRKAKSLTDADLSDEECRRFVDRDLAEVAACDLLVWLAGKASIGAPWECGYGDAVSQVRGAPEIFVAGGDPRHPFVVARADGWGEDDSEAVAWVATRADRLIAEMRNAIAEAAPVVERLEAMGSTGVNTPQKEK